MRFLAVLALRRSVFDDLISDLEEHLVNIAARLRRRLSIHYIFVFASYLFEVELGDYGFATFG